MAMLDGWTPDLIIVDYSMPEMNGAEFTRAVRLRPETSEVPVVVITAYDDREFRLAALEAGATDFLQSPVDRREFQSRVRALLAFRRQQLSIKDRAAAFEVGAGMALALPAMLGSESHVLGQVLDSIPIMISAVDRDGRCLFANAQFAAHTGSTPAMLVGKALDPMFGPASEEREARTNALVIETGTTLPAYEDVSERDGVNLVYLTHKSPLRDMTGKVAGVLTSSVDITGRKRAETHLNHLARHDVLTGLPNRILFRDKLQAALAAAGRTDGIVAVFLLDLDRFKFINDTRGHRTGDLLLEKVAVRIGQMMGPGDCAARLGGTSSPCSRVGLKDQAEVLRRAEQLVAAIDRTYTLESHDIVVTASLGISIAPADGAIPGRIAAHRRSRHVFGQGRGRQRVSLLRARDETARRRSPRRWRQTSTARSIARNSRSSSSRSSPHGRAS